MRAAVTLVLAIGLLLMLVNVPYTPVYAQSWWDYNWQYRIPITITNRISDDLYNYQILIEVDTQSLISDGKMNNDCSDIRFVAEDGTELNYWIEPQTINTANTKIWVKVPHIPGSGEVTIYMYYGNPASTSLSSLLNVMEQLPASDGSGYIIYYQEWIMPENRFQAIGNPTGIHCDDCAGSHSLSFTFPFYDRTTTITYIGSNGYFFPYNGYTTDYTSTESEFYHRKMIAPFWADLRTDGGYGIFIDSSYSDEYGSGEYIRWYTRFYGGSGGAQNFAIVIYSNGLIRFDYGEIYGTSSTDDSPVIGVSRGDGIHYTLSSYNGLRYPSNYNSVMFWPRKKASTEPTYTFGSEQVRPSGEGVHVIVTVQSSSGEPFSGLQVEAWQGASILGSGSTGRNGKANIVANYGEVTIKVVAGGKVVNETTVEITSDGQEIAITLNCEMIVIANQDVLSSHEPDVIPYIALCTPLMVIPGILSRRRKSIQTWVAIVLAIIITIAVAVPIYLWVATFTAPTETFRPTQLAAIDTSTEAGGVKLTIKNLGEYTDKLHAIYIKQGPETVESYDENTPVYVVTDTLHTVRLGDIKLKPGTTLTIIIPSILQPGVTYTIKIIGKANSILQIEVVGE